MWAYGFGLFGIVGDDMKTRDRLLKLLSIANKPLNAYEITVIIDAWAGSVYILLLRLKNEGLIAESKIDGRWVYYLVDKDL